MAMRLEALCHNLKDCAKSKCEHDYVEDLRTSCASLEKHEQDTRLQKFLANKRTGELFQAYFEDCKTYFNNLNLALNHILTSEIRASDGIAAQVKHSVRTPPIFWLSHLNLECYASLPAAWKAVFIEYGLAVTQLHRAQRLVSLSDKQTELFEELNKPGHLNWNPSDNPEWLLLEAEAGIMVRKVQATIAEQMMHPPDNTNTMMQLNMGEGKSSVIGKWKISRIKVCTVLTIPVVPIVAASLADKKT